VTAGPSVARESPWREAIIERIEHRTPRVSSIFLRADLPPSQAGQHVDVRLTAPDGYQAQRSYSIASAPGAPAIELAIERLGHGEVSPYFVDIARPGDTIELRGPLGGHFIWGARDGGPLLLVGGGSGVAPLMAILRHRARVAPETPALLVYSSRTWDEIIFRDELLEAEASDPNVDVVFATTRAPRQRVTDFDRRLDIEALREILMRWGESPEHVYVCGATPFVESMANALVLEGLAPGRIKAERYGGASSP
jgi:ferredoxin-NADP reductase